MAERAQIIIAGAGFSGLATAIRLKQQGKHDFLVLERAEDVGGVWRLNTYPGCTCDVPSHLYSLSFAPNPEWTHTYSPQPEIRDYLRRTAEEAGILPHIRTGVGVETATWSQDDQRWTIDTNAGSYTASVFISSVGPLTEPNLPDVPGLQDFKGKLMHSARWDHDYDLSGKRVASIGTGASAIQYVPRIVDQVEQLDVFQRTPPWVMPHGNRAITDFERAPYRRVPAAQQLVRSSVYASREILVLGMVKDPRLLGLPRHRHPVCEPRPRTRRRGAAGLLAGQPARVPRHLDPRVSQLLHAAGTEHRPRSQLDGVHDRVTGRPRRRSDRGHGTGRRGHDRGAARHPREVQPRCGRADAGNRLGHRWLLQLLHRPDRAQRHAVARLDLAFSPARPAFSGDAYRVTSPVRELVTA